MALAARALEGAVAPLMVWLLDVACAALDCTLELAAEVDGAKELLEPAAAGAEPEAGLLAEADCEALFCGDVREAVVPPEAAERAADC
ncbi:MAG TPA: hypothetical protein DGP39_08765 [Verrucomicrobiales bacterium]|nr:hypothetical protein [Verrucomicrobiales bacterium]